MSADENPSADVIVGIDLGTTNSLVAVCDERGARVLAGPDDEAIVPSVVRYERDEAAPGGVRTVVGREAKSHAVEFPQRTVASVKRLMGRSVADAAGDLKYLGYRVVEDEHAQARVELKLDEHTERIVSPQEVSAVILRDLRARAEHALGRAVRKAVVTVPAYFDDAQRQATRDAGRLAGLEVVRIVNEPTAAALAYGIGLGRESARHEKPETVVVYDLGGGTFDVSVLRLTPAAGEGGTGFFQVLSTAGDTRLGGDDVDHMLVSLFVREIGQMLGTRGERADDPARFPPATRRALKEFAESVKHRLSEEESASVAVRINEDRVYERTVTRAELEEMMAAWVERTMRACDRAMRDAGDAVAGGVDAVILVGGSTRVPLVRARVAQRFGLEPYAALDPDRVVALGAAVQGSILSGATRGQLLLDVIPLSLGIETVGGAVSKQIVRNSTVPARATELYTTSVDGQTNIRLSVYQGEREMAEDCRRLGVFELRGIPPMPAGVPQVEVEFLVDANGVLSVSARERRSGKRASLQVIPNHGLTREEVDRIEAESFEHARDDMTRHRIVDLVANSRLDIKWIRERLEKHAGALESEYRGELEGRLGALESLAERAAADWRAVDADELARAKQALDEASVRLQEVSIAASLREDGPAG